MVEVWAVLNGFLSSYWKQWFWHLSSGMSKLWQNITEEPGKNLCHRVITMTNSNSIKFQYQYRKRSPLGSIFGDTHLKEITKPSKVQTSLGFFFFPPERATLNWPKHLRQKRKIRSSIPNPDSLLIITASGKLRK